mmetsp:Transcript_70977/g.117944  ORF Transcript_70977/g.117944 Transcript_70977/m.117944 type:complete len:90 (+) Transcript_70977:478-747(+)
MAEDAADRAVGATLGAAAAAASLFMLACSFRIAARSSVRELSDVASIPSLVATVTQFPLLTQLPCVAAPSPPAFVPGLAAPPAEPSIGC